MFYVLNEAVLDESVFECVFGRQCVFGRKCFWMKVFLDENVPNRQKRHGAKLKVSKQKPGLPLNSWRPLLKSARTSASDGVVPSAPEWPRRSSNEDATSQKRPPPSVMFPVCAERRDESGVDGQLRRAVPPQSPRCDPGRRSQPDPDLAGTHLWTLWLLLHDIHVLPQTPVLTPSPQHTCQRTTCTVMAKAVERTATPAMNGKTGEEED